VANKIRRYCGIAEEAVYGEESSPEAAVHLDIASASLDVPTDTNIFYEGGAQRSARLHRPGFYAPTGDIVYALDIRTIGWFLKWALGQYVYTGAGGSNGTNLHEFYGTKQTRLSSFCARIGKDIFEHIFSGCIINSLEINVGDALCMATVDVAAKQDAKGALETGDLLFPEEYPLAFHEVTAYLIGSPDDEISTKVKELTLTINNNASADDGRHVGSRHPGQVPVGDRETTLSLDLFYEDTDMLEKLWGGSVGPAAGGSTEYGIRLELDAGVHGVLKVDLPKVINTTVGQQPSGRDEVTQNVEVRALIDTIVLDDGSTEVDSEILASLENNEDEMSVTS